jgi:hypothetical protein
MIKNIETITDAEKALCAIERRKEAYKRYKTKLLLKLHNIDNVDELIQMKKDERIRRYQEGYQRHLEQMKQQRRERGLKPKGRPFKNTDNERKRSNLNSQLEFIDNIEMNPTSLLDTLDD